MKRVYRRPVAGLAVIGVAALIAGCGGGSDSEALSADELRSQADAICADVNRTTDAIAEPTSNETVLPFLQATREAQAAGLDRLKELSPPDDLADTWNEAIALNEEQLEAIDEAISRIEGGESPDAVIGDLSPGLEQRQGELRTKAGELGLTVCGAGDEDDEPEPTMTEATDTTATTLDPAPTEPTGNVGTVQQYISDVRQTVGALQNYGTLLQGITSQQDLAAKAPQARAALDEFDAGIAQMGTYTLDVPTAERQRANLVAEGPRVSDVLLRFVNAAEAGDAAAVQSILPEVMSALQAFVAAAQDVS